MDIHINYLAVLVASVVYFLIGFVWYSFICKKVYFKEMGFAKLPKKEQEVKRKTIGRSMAINFVANLLAAYCLSYSVVSHPAGLSGGLQAGFWVTLGFIATSQLNGVIWGTHSVKLYLINMGYYFVSFLSMGAILALWQ